MKVRYWQVALGVFFLGWIFMYADRTVLSPVLGSIGREWSLDERRLGLISSLFFLAYAGLQLPTGWLADRFGRKVVLVPGYFLFAATTLLSAFAPGYAVFLALAFASGLGEGTYYPTQFSLSSQVIPRQYRSLGSAIINSGQAFGISLGFVASAYVAFDLRAGWRASFAALGAATALAGVVLLLAVREHPPQEGSPSVPTSPREPPERRAAGLASRDLVLAYITGFCSLYGFFVILTWLPYYLHTVRHELEGVTGVVSSLVPWASIPGALLISHLSDRLHHRRLVALIILPLAAISVFAIPIARSPIELYGALVLYGLVGKLALDPILLSYVADRVPVSAYSRAFAILNFAGMSSSILAPYLTGFLAERTGSLDSGFYLATALLFAGTLCMALTHPERRAGGRDGSAPRGHGALAGERVPGAAKEGDAT